MYFNRRRRQVKPELGSPRLNTRRSDANTLPAQSANAKKPRVARLTWSNHLDGVIDRIVNDISEMEAYRQIDQAAFFDQYSRADHGTDERPYFGTSFG